MSRKAREKSSLGIYMIYLKAIEGISFDTEDKIAFLNIISQEEASLLAYTLLNNSFMFVARQTKHSIEDVLRVSTIKFAKKYNKTYERKGKVFVGRYVSFPANTNEEVLKIISDVHFASSCNRDVISSKFDYTQNKYIDYSYIHNMFDIDDINNIVYSTYGQGAQRIKMSDKEVYNYIIENFNIQPENMTKISKGLVEKILSNIFTTTKVSVRQIARISSLPLRMLWNFAKKIKINVKPETQRIKNENKTW